MNIILLSGRLVKDPELKYTQSGKAVVKFTIACQKKFKNSITGQYESNFINCQAWDKTAEFISNNVVKGNRVELQGTLENNNYEKDGQRVFQDIVNVESFNPIDWKESKIESEVKRNNDNSNKYNYEIRESDLPF